MTRPITLGEWTGGICAAGAVALWFLATADRNGTLLLASAVLAFGAISAFFAATIGLDRALVAWVKMLLKEFE